MFRFREHNVIFSSTIDKCLLQQDFTEGDFEDLYSGVTGEIAFFKELDIECRDYYTAVISKNGEIGIELLYADSDSGESCGIFKFDLTKDTIEESFKSVYQEFLKRVEFIIKSHE